MTHVLWYHSSKCLKNIKVCVPKTLRKRFACKYRLQVFKWLFLCKSAQHSRFSGKLHAGISQVYAHGYQAAFTQDNVFIFRETEMPLFFSILCIFQFSLQPWPLQVNSSPSVTAALIRRFLDQNQPQPFQTLSSAPASPAQQLPQVLQD